MLSSSSRIDANPCLSISDKDRGSSVRMEELFDAIRAFNANISPTSAAKLKESIRLVSLSAVSEKDAIGPLLSSALLQTLARISEVNNDDYNVIALVISKLLLFCKEASSVKLSINKFPDVHSIILSLLLMVQSIVDQIEVVLLLYKTHERNKPYDLLLFTSKVDATQQCLNDCLSRLNTPSFYKECRGFLYFFNRKFQTKVTSVYLTNFAISPSGIFKDKILADMFASMIFIHKSELSLSDHIVSPIDKIKGHFNHLAINKFQFRISLGNEDQISFSIINEDRSEKLDSLLKSLEVGVDVSSSSAKSSPKKSLKKQHKESCHNPTLLPSPTASNAMGSSPIKASYPDLGPMSSGLNDIGLMGINGKSKFEIDSEIENLSASKLRDTIVNPDNLGTSAFSSNEPDNLMSCQPQYSDRQCYQHSEQPSYQLESQSPAVLATKRISKAKNPPHHLRCEEKSLNDSISSILITPPQTIRKRSRLLVFSSNFIQVSHQNIRNALASAKSMNVIFYVRKNKATDAQFRYQSN